MKITYNSETGSGQLNNNYNSHQKSEIWPKFGKEEWTTEEQSSFSRPLCQLIAKICGKYSEQQYSAAPTSIGRVYFPILKMRWTALVTGQQCNGSDILWVLNLGLERPQLPLSYSWDSANDSLIILRDHVEQDYSSWIVLDQPVLGDLPMTTDTWASPNEKLAEPGQSCDPQVKPCPHCQIATCFKWRHFGEVFVFNFIYLFLAMLSFSCCTWAFSSCCEQMLVASMCGLLIVVASLVQHRL